MPPSPRFASLPFWAALAWGAALLLVPLGPPPQAQEASPVQELAPVTVIGHILDIGAAGRTTIGREVLEGFPRGNGSVNEVLDVLPDVQLRDPARSSLTGGEILPPDVSISGGRAYQNVFTIDGIGNNSLLDPTTRNPHSVGNVPGHPQEIFLDTSLVEEITLYDTNVPARFGGFTGGVVETTARGPRKRYGGNLFFRTTRDGWTEFHLDDADRYDFDHSNTASRQPRFEKQHAGISLDLPLTERLGLLPAYQLLHSRIPLAHLGGYRDQIRRLENYTLKATSDLSPDDLLDLTAVYSPYRSDHFIPNALGSDFRIEGSGLLSALRYYRFFPAGDLDLRAAYRQSENSRDAPRHFRSWAATDTKDWGRAAGSDYSQEGGWGDIEKTQRTWQFKGDVTLAPLLAGPAEHGIGLGWDMENTRGTYDRPLTTYDYRQARISPDIVCGEDQFACEEGEQFFTERKVYRKSSTEATITQVALYAEDRARFGNFQALPGLRLSYDDFMKNANLSPRLSLSYDLKGKGRTVITGGLNRYYGRTLLTYKLREAIAPPAAETRTSHQNRLTAWEPAPFQGTNVHRFSRLDTPRSDEATLGLDQSLMGGRLSLKYVYREGSDEFARQYGPLQPDGLRYYRLTNEGCSRHDSLRLSWERSWPGHSLALNAVWRQTRSTNTDLDEIINEEEGEARVWFGNEIVYLGQLPEENDERWEGKLTYIARLPFGLTFTNFTKYTGSYRDVANTDEEKPVPEGERRIDPGTGEEIVESLAVYERVKRPDALTFDWKLAWQRELGPALLALNAEISNVFNSRIRIEEGAGYRLGRQFWVGVECFF